MAAVLLVDDVMIARYTLRLFLERGGHAVTECSGGDEALPVLTGGRFDVLVTDVWMAGGDGLQLIRRVKEAGMTVPIVAVTGGAPRAPQEFSADEAQKAGADRVLMKPVGLDELLRAVAELTATRQAGMRGGLR
ncbi:two component, sigma54 specific, transcriptional regulator, Fis family [Rhodovulum sp. PH10]|uniref:response regulator n=1 Tax=Rhodovulum sp. PH10 TaxID=1187851 RepID=UPI00027C207A|nr:response regulator [Rhodovulum sp. PH10]EJW10864.1 two component, sigma54 specific, transcriptional regulator, Fis family [Rhodovulum sp. PH10]